MKKSTRSHISCRIILLAIYYCALKNHNISCDQHDSAIFTIPRNRFIVVGRIKLPNHPDYYAIFP